MTENIVVFGASGAVGRRAVYYAALDPRVSRVTAVLRAKQAPDQNVPRDLLFYGFQSADAQAASKVEQKYLDFDALKQNTASARASTETSGLAGSGGNKIDTATGSDCSVLEQQDYTCGVSCLGVYTASMSSLRHFEEVEHDTNITIARIMAERGVKRWSYLSGMGVTRPPLEKTKPGIAEAMFSYVKGSTERDLASLMPSSFTAVRPGVIMGRQGSQTGLSSRLEGLANTHMSWLGRTSYGVECDVVAECMVLSVLAPDRGSETLENNEIKERVQKEGRSR